MNSGDIYESKEETENSIQVYVYIFACMRICVCIYIDIDRTYIYNKNICIYIVRTYYIESVDCYVFFIFNTRS